MTYELIFDWLVKTVVIFASQKVPCVSSATTHLVLLGGSICGGCHLLAAPPGVSLVSAGGHLLSRPLPQHLVQVEPAPVAHEERTHLNRRAETES